MIKNIAENILSFAMDFNVEEIHKTSIKILDEIGIYIGSNNGLNLLDSIGCRVDYKSKNVKIPPSIIYNAHEKVNKILKDYKVPELPSDVLKEMDDIVAGALNRESVDSKDI